MALTRRTFVSRVMSLLFNMLSRFVIALLSRSKHLNFMAAVTICSDFGTQENNPILLNNKSGGKKKATLDLAQKLMNDLYKRCYYQRENNVRMC